MDKDLSKLAVANGKTDKPDDTKKKSLDSFTVGQKNIKEIFKKRQKSK